MKIKNTYLLIISAIVMIAVMFQACGTDSNDPVNLNIESITAGGVDLNTAQSPDDVPVDATIEITFNSNVKASTATSANISLIQDYDDTNIPLQISASGQTITIQLQEELSSGALYELILGAGLLNEEDQPLATTSRSFTTAGTFSPSGMVAHWTFEDSPDDITGNYPSSADVDMTYTESRNSEAGLAATFNGNTSIIEIPNADELINTSDFTLSFWVKTNSEGHVNENGDPTGHFVIGLGAFWGIQFEVTANYESAKFAIQFETADGTPVGEDMWFPAEATDANSGGWQGWDFAKSLTIEQMVNLLKDNWLHVTLSYDGNDRKARLYYDGELMKSFDFDLWPEDSIQRTVTGIQYAGQEPDVVNDLAFGFIQSRAGTMWDNEPWGGYDFPTAQHFKGQLDDIKVYHKVLTDTEIQLMYQSEN
ncbi:LamG-like jellyroll fold domain-containing protein [Rhodohalobacter sp.]|uniref:LamG-like jellyroll fold domain-containing protein n=1 Tax=Rhodohalobacter sp. TaxID=1974210 RepID=UPI002ACE233C|nr:LamG-like jellyroll fold domain-containing protein [Rhodohalobacter sp.]MDZ7757305.1 LamG-like jellyroll fold domain-containing protein [Rhodohalobacter sp.]